MTLEQLSSASQIVAAIGEPALWGAGYGARALRLALQEAFVPRDTHIQRLYATIHRENTRSLRLFLHAGFVSAGEAGACMRLSMTREAYFTAKNCANSGV